MILVALGTWAVAPVEATEWLPNIGIGSGWVILGVGLATNRLMTRSQHMEQMAAVQATYQRQVDDLAHDRGEWRAESRIKDAQYEVGVDRNFELLKSVAETVVATFDAIKDNAEHTARGTQDGGAS